VVEASKKREEKRREVVRGRKEVTFPSMGDYITAPFSPPTKLPPQQPSHHSTITYH
jgi:hypothetical protein